MSLSGLDPRSWDLLRLLATFEMSMRRNCKDAAEWGRIQASLTAEPPHVREQRRQAARSGRAPVQGGQMSVQSAQSLLARFAASEAAYS